ncbi:putative GNS1/SUR4 family protein [Drepanopeziza brunnea f. sp. 'multigermtubi' MB_m1]|uniref:Elongation of fatty acids protein n=1 Tax=Marssonina brunnea f. sp. multigermtubi (strain MB_m1) TaxID=1072389 RepID=K1X5Y3_MARBU|nr:putative GNS1/SUR4 family protein [Drepanopeziza brunnea f. sp. 'multigermtubi' MB_m1]EKD20547.1 putative GNS1/SUR4 family protein [Drepanopeziza brunnea f. sp. 'multigermtubi' MB_m1]
MSSAKVMFSLPDSKLFQLPPRNDPQALPPPTAGTTLFAPPISIPPSIYNAALDVKVPVTVAIVYALTVTILNKANRDRGMRPWAISKTKPFFWFVVAHNVFLALYSAWTFVGMFGALQRVLPSWNGFGNITPLVDSLCKMHGPHGLGNAVSYNPAISQWISTSPSVFLSEAGTPAGTDVGRLWNEGLAFYGWLFYLSKFYEVLDTAIILAKGKRSSTLQKYHHAGAMMCMWAGIRFMSPPIWMFVFVNSAIHAMMYTYYTLAAFSIHVPQSIKQSLTTMQITQFLVGFSYAALHSFVSYTIPVQVADVESTLKTTVTAATAAASSAVATAASNGFGKTIMKFLYRAVGEEGLAENVNGAAPTAHAVPSFRSGGIQYRTEYQTVPCIDTSGQTFAIWLNVFYLTPLTFLFARFFVKSYLRRNTQRTVGPEHIKGGAAKDALKGVDRNLNGNANGIANGKTNGHTNGHANGKANGTPNGKSNGKVNGKP